jgi:hypothetical protein
MFFAVVVKPPESAIVVAILFVLLMAVIAADLVLSTRLIKRFNNTKLVKRREILEETWDKAGIDIKAMEKRIKRYLNTCRLLHVLFVLLCMASIYCSVIFLDTDIFVLMIMIRILFLLSSFALWGLVSLFVFKNKQDNQQGENQFASFTGRFRRLDGVFCTACCNIFVMICRF